MGQTSLCPHFFDFLHTCNIVSQSLPLCNTIDKFGLAFSGSNVDGPLVRTCDILSPLVCISLINCRPAINVNIEYQICHFVTVCRGRAWGCGESMTQIQDSDECSVFNYSEVNSTQQLIPMRPRLPCSSSLLPSVHVPGARCPLISAILLENTEAAIGTSTTAINSHF